MEIFASTKKRTFTWCRRRKSDGFSSKKKSAHETGGLNIAHLREENEAVSSRFGGADNLLPVDMHAITGIQSNFFIESIISGELMSFFFPICSDDTERTRSKVCQPSRELDSR
jgi:hypothetical protein